MKSAISLVRGLRFFELLNTYKQVTTLQPTLTLRIWFSLMKLRNISMSLKRGLKSIWYEWMTELKLSFFCSRTFTETNSEQQQLHKHHENNRFLHEKKKYVLLKISLKNFALKMSPFHSESSHTKIASNLIIPCPVAAALCSSQSVSAERLMSTSVPHSNSKPSCFCL